jgi:hypothetical protein
MSVRCLLYIFTSVVTEVNNANRPIEKCALCVI